MSEYDIENLLKTFHHHAMEAEKQREKDLTEFRRNYPGQSIPKRMQDDFSLPKALHSMCKEILWLIGKVEE